MKKTLQNRKKKKRKQKLVIVSPSSERDNFSITKLNRTDTFGNKFYEVL